MTSRPTLYEIRQNPHTISFCQVLVVHSKTWVRLFKDEKGRICYGSKEDATVKMVLNGPIIPGLGTPTTNFPLFLSFFGIDFHDK